MGFHEDQEEILASADNHYFVDLWNLDRIDQRQCDCAIYLYSILKVELI